jgi:flagellar biosynthesis/type III secretory pathway protein FliH
MKGGYRNDYDWISAKSTPTDETEEAESEVRKAEEAPCAEASDEGWEEGNNAGALAQGEVIWQPIH